ncbi:zf-C3HC4-domain-containing protein [Epithele typhae]|uniref:zf-C3HC4-domain-containing protein n=1 Tax=Epithele typhae TaxID=378194 RepID=UPI0020079AC7|nr:zf-C3HC4-domain-containing protein [Epithele typhae]KAH9944288.1 zf-C3HC4-domain-containing protein [Epithele typhae]
MHEERPEAEGEGERERPETLDHAHDDSEPGTKREQEETILSETETQPDNKQCRICLEGADPDLGRLIRPCLCKGSISCGYHYHFARTRVLGIATNPVVIAVVSSLIFTTIVLISSFITTFFTAGEDEDGTFSYTNWYPLEIFRSLVRMTIGILVDDNMIDDSTGRHRRRTAFPPQPQKPPGLLLSLFRRFLLGLPVVGAGSIAHMLISIPFPFHWLRLRTRRARVGRESKDLMALIILAVVLAGAARQVPLFFI